MTVEDITQQEIREDETANQEIAEDKTAIIEYFEVVRAEYEIERGKKSSLETRAGLIMGLLGVLSIFLFEHIKIKDIIILMKQSINFFLLIKIISGISVYISFFITLIFVFKIIISKKHPNFEVGNIDEEMLREKRIDALAKIIFTYRDVISMHREINENRAIDFKYSIYGAMIIIVSAVTNISL